MGGGYQEKTRKEQNNKRLFTRFDIHYPGEKLVKRIVSHRKVLCDSLIFKTIALKFLAFTPR